MKIINGKIINKEVTNYIKIVTDKLNLFIKKTK